MEAHQIIITVLTIVVCALAITLGETISSNKKLKRAIYRWAKELIDNHDEIQKLKLQRNSALDDLSDARKELEDLKSDLAHRY